MLPQQSYALQVRDRLRNPPNATKDDGIDLRRRFKEVPAPPAPPPTPRKVVSVADVMFDWNCRRYFNSLFDTPTQEAAPKVAAVSAYVSVADIIRAVTVKFSLGQTDISSARRTANVVRPRQIAMWLSKTLTLRSLPDIGRRMGGRDHTTILHGIRKIEYLRQRDEALQAELDQFVSALRPPDQENCNAEDPSRLRS